jgi:hypothetical protein
MKGAPFQGRGLRFNEMAIAVGAQTERQGETGLVRILLGGKASPAAFLCFTMLHET